LQILARSSRRGSTNLHDLVPEVLRSVEQGRRYLRTRTRAGSEKPLYQWISEEYVNSDHNWATIDAVVHIAKEIGATPAQVALSWLADRPGVIAPIVGARTVEHLRGNLGAAELTLDDEATAALEKVSGPQSGGYPYGAFGAVQRARWLQDGTPATTSPYTAGSEHPTGHA
jgi:diketogulonate reductase-like aldo/keto reductase